MSGLDIALYAGFIRGDYAPDETQFKYRMKKMGARIRKPQTIRVGINKSVNDGIRSYKPRSIGVKTLPDCEFINATDLLQCVPIAQKTIKELIKKNEFPDSAKGKCPRYWKTQEVQHWLDTQNMD